MVVHEQMLHYQQRSFIEYAALAQTSHYQLFPKEVTCCFILKDGHIEALELCHRVGTLDFSGSSPRTDIIMVPLPDVLVQELGVIGMADLKQVDTQQVLEASRELLDKYVESLLFYFKLPCLVTDRLIELKVEELLLIFQESA